MTIFNSALALVCGLTVFACSEGKSNGTGGTGGMGGSAGMGGTGGSGGGEVNKRCAAGPTVAAGDKPIIDNFDDGNLAIIVPEGGTEDGRSGEFYATETTTGLVVNAGTELHFTASPASGQWPSFGVPVATCYDGTAYAGVSFKIKGTGGPIKFVVATPPTTPIPEGACTTGDLCYDAFGFTIAALNATEYQTVEIPWGSLMQAGWGTKAPEGYKPQSEIMELAWGVGADSGVYDVYLDDLSFLKP